MMKEGIKMKHIVLGVTGSIAAYKACDLVSQLSKIKDIEIDVIMTKAACEFITPLTFESLLHKKVYLDPFISLDGQINHITLAQKADLMVMVPASANSIAKIVNGLANDLLSDTWLAATCPKMIFPAMNTNMYENPITKHNIELAKSYGISVIEPSVGHLACGQNGKGKLVAVDEIVEVILAALEEKQLSKKKILISAGPTQEALDPVRFITNHSTGKMGYALAKQASRMGAEVTLVSGPSQLKAPLNTTLINVTSSQDMANVILAQAPNFDYIIMSAAVADYRPQNVASQKIKKHDQTLTVNLEKTTDILATLGQQKKANQILCGFAMETENLIENASLKLEKKNCDMIVANSIAQKDAGFGVDTNITTFITKTGTKAIPLMLKESLAKEILLTLKQMEESK
jgi:phosphopantothenoylcysteine decarboxylase/phosphopantothenate--cysteine ligase, prokaryotic